MSRFTDKKDRPPHRYNINIIRNKRDGTEAGEGEERRRERGGERQVTILLLMCDRSTKSGRTTSVSTELPSIKNPEQHRDTIKLLMFKMPYLCRFENFYDRCIFLEGREFSIVSPPTLPNQVTLVWFPRIVYFVGLLFCENWAPIK